MSNDTEDKIKIEAKPMPITILTQYLKEVSFENAGAPDSLRSGRQAPAIDLNIGMDARTIPSEQFKHLFEVIVTLSATAVQNEQPVFSANVVYGAVAAVDETVPEDQHHPICLIEIPRHIFPFARQVLSEVTTQGGYPPLLLNPVDFQSLYFDRFRKEIEESMKEIDKNINIAGNA